MKKTFLQIIVIILLVSCAPTMLTPQDSEISVTETPEIPTYTPLPTQTESPAPTLTITPMSVVSIEPNPLALNEFNAGIEMKRLNVIGTGEPHDIEFSPDGSLLAIATGRGIYLYNGETFEQSGFIDINDSVTAIAFSPNGEAIALAVDGKTSIWNVNSGKKLKDLEDEIIHVSEIAYGENGYVAAIGGDCRGCGTPVVAMILWSGETGKKVYEERDIWYSTKALDFTPDGKTLFFGGKNGLTSIDIKSGNKITYSKSTSRRDSAADTPLDFILDDNSGKIYVISPEKEAIEAINLKDKTIQLYKQCQPYQSYSYSPFIKLQAMGICVAAGEIILFDLMSGNKTDSIKVGTDSNILIAISFTGDRLVYTSKYGLEAIELPTKKVINTIPTSSFEYIQAGIIEIDNQTLYTVAALSHPGKIDIFNIQTGELIRTLQLECCKIEDFTFAPDHKTAATLHDSTLSVWNIETQNIIYELKTDQKYLSRIAFSPDGTKIYLIDYENHILEANLQNGEINKIKGETDGYGSPLAADNFQFSKDGNLVLLGYKISNNYYSPVFTGIISNEIIKIPYTARSEFDFIETFAVDSKNQYLATGTANGIFIWKISSNNLLFKLEQHEQRFGDGWIGAIDHLVFSPTSSNLLASVGFDGTTRLWNVKSGIELRRLNVCCSVSFTPDGRYLVTAGDGVIRVWGIP